MEGSLSPMPVKQIANISSPTCTTTTKHIAPRFTLERGWV
ncbi:hypothetical protein HMPREF1991_03127 [Hoylesella loescheii DSM 19665 = JCM 12249 = ATCC 15930]|uniref:Uncharacterized protein n=1 Tax=Hoylesella loescheii DSM 19665 = JCM 12249 = ATCC 15930 TaxID=1122985 RepID=A0A069QDE4_HOYLO|nr:hypothetical protein HMPREF1991_03127 [Hoylesella loescheii DSM 19665 = JCM 12249 = ATCC 15930]